MAKCKNCKDCKFEVDCILSDSEREKLKICLIFEERNPITNAMKIRSMTDEELRDFLYDMTSESKCHVCAFKKGWLCEKPYDKSCHDGVMEWLKSEVGCK